MAQLKFTPLEFQIMKTLWNRRAASIREVQEAFPEDERPAYTTVQTTIYRFNAESVFMRTPHSVDRAAVISRSFHSA